MRIGLDFDNTLVSYDALFVESALKKGWLDDQASWVVGQKGVRQNVRMLADGEKKWQILQALIYGPRMAEAKEMEGVAEFLKEGKKRGVEFFIVSHKTQFARRDTIKRYDLQQLALAWMTKKGFFRSDGFGLFPDNVFFAPSRQEKIARIDQLKCSHFVDDLPELLTDPHFPSTTSRLLIDPHQDAPKNSLYRIFSHWNQLSQELFGIEHST